MITKALNLANEIKNRNEESISPALARQIISLIDYTTLNDDDTPESVSLWMKNSIALMEKHQAWVGGWCTYSEFLTVVSTLRKERPAAIAAVAGNFPSGKASTFLKIQEAIEAEINGADEIDLVINKGWAKDNRYSEIGDEIAAVKRALKKAHLKVIMETGMLSADQIKLTSEAAINAGADFIKTSTGKTAVGATLEAVSIMCFCIKEHYRQTGRRVGIKPSGGISTPEEAAKYLRLVESILGLEWINPSLFRLGASRLLNHSIEALKQKNV